MLNKKIIGLVASRDPSVEEPTPDQCYTIGTAAVVQRLLRLPDGTIRLLVLGLERIRITEYTTSQPYLKARVEPAPEYTETTVESGSAAPQHRRDVRPPGGTGPRHSR